MTYDIGQIIRRGQISRRLEISLDTGECYVTKLHSLVVDRLPDIWTEKQTRYHWILAGWLLFEMRSIASNVSKQGRRKTVGKGEAVKGLRAIETCKKQKIMLPIMLFLFSNNADLKNNTKNYRKTFLSFWCANICNKFVQFDFDKPWNYLWYFIKKNLRPRRPLMKGQGGQCPCHAHALPRPCFQGVSAVT